MSILRVGGFGGMIPRVGQRLLPDTAAADARNAKLLSGELRPWNGYLPLSPLDVYNPITVFHFEYLNGDYYMSFDELTWVVQSPLLNDSIQRIYWANSTGIWQNTKPRIINGDPPYKVGVPTPTTGTVTATPIGGTLEFQESRVYTWTFVSGFNEEGAPAAPIVVTDAKSDGTVQIDGLDTVGYTGTWDNIAKLRLYRTVTTLTGVDYYQVAEWPVGAVPASYVDSLTNLEAAENSVLESFNWTPPPDGMLGLVAAGGGFMVGFVGRNVFASVAFRPWAWPIDYQVGVEDQVVGLGAYGNSVVVCTSGNPYIIQSATPDAIVLSKIKAVLPCLSPRSIVSTVASVLYSSENGIVSVADAGTNIATTPYLTRDEWLRDYSPRTIFAAVAEDRYIAFYSKTDGFILGFDDPSTGFTRLTADGVTSIDTSAVTGQGIVGVNGVAYGFDRREDARLLYTWRSKPFQIPRPLNYGVIQLRGTFEGTIVPPVPPAGSGAGSAFNGMVYNASVFNAAPSGPAPPPPAPPQPTLLPVAVKVYGDNVLRWTGVISDEKVYRLPSGFKCTLWQVEVSGSASLVSVTLAGTGKELENAP